MSALSAFSFVSDTSTTTDPLPGLTSLTEAINHSLGSFVLSTIALAVAAICAYGLLSGLMYSTAPKVAVGVLAGAAAIFGLAKAADAYTTLNNATSGLLGQLLSIIGGFLPLILVAGLLYFITASLRRY